jgi:serine/threonine protein kinase
MICANCHGQAVGDVCGECGDATLLDNRYRLEDLLGSGASGMTFRATNLESGESVAIKELDWRKLDALKTEQLFNREADVLRQLDHPGIPRYIETFTRESGRHVAAYLVQEFIDGQTLEDEQADRRYDLADVLDIADELLEIVAYLHARVPPVIHRDIKPKNVMRRNAGDLVMIDFGSVRSVANVEGGSTIAGTVGYMAPEQLVGKAMPASDLFGVGALIAALVSGIDPSNYLGVGKPDLWRNFVKVPRPVEELLAMLLEPDPGERADDARFVQQWVRDLRVQSEAGFPSDVPSVLPTRAAQPPAPAQHAQGASVQTRMGAVLAGVLVSLLFTAGAVSFLVTSEPERHTLPEDPPGESAAQVIEFLEVGQLGPYAKIGDHIDDITAELENDPNTGKQTFRADIADMVWSCSLEFRLVDGQDTLQSFDCTSPPLGPATLRDPQAIADDFHYKYGEPNTLMFNKSVWETKDVIMSLERIAGSPERMQFAARAKTNSIDIEALPDPDQP